MNGLSHNIQFPGATAADMAHYVKPALMAKLNVVILHVCTNDIKNNSPDQVQSICNLEDTVASSSSSDQSRLDNDNDDHDDHDDGDVTKTNDNENVNPLDPITPTTDQYEKVYPKLKGFKIRHLNIASLVKHNIKTNYWFNFLAKLPFDVICINETRLDDSIDNSEVKIPGYDLVRKDI
ncbi:RNA-directed DNA polymerase from transposon BS [Paramuricea clavata]|uniref:RNA-directed DNA polymerase from transposon BS n=1 Tax=Paramuricea clavata TaxID=317549 RepID=A0A6S7HQV2_PARCT|nr:RNA-directed DNA polymerase from transposon BS [Paramuricea clavata]